MPSSLTYSLVRYPTFPSTQLPTNVPPNGAEGLSWHQRFIDALPAVRQCTVQTICTPKRNENTAFSDKILITSLLNPHHLFTYRA
jgi:hypothetical protein